MRTAKKKDSSLAHGAAKKDGRMVKGTDNARQQREKIPESHGHRINVLEEW